MSEKLLGFVHWNFVCKTFITFWINVIGLILIFFNASFFPFQILIECLLSSVLLSRDVASQFVAPRCVWFCLHPTLTLVVPRAWEIGYTQPCIKCKGKSATHFVYFWSRKTLLYTHLEVTSYIPQQGQSLHIYYSLLQKQVYSTIFMNGVYEPICYGNFKQWNWVSTWHYKG